MRWTSATAIVALTATFMLGERKVGAQQLQTPTPPPARPVIVIDPAHGGSDGGDRVADRVLEKAVTLELANRLRPLLLARGFDVRMTREKDPEGILTVDQRAGTANQQHPTACLVLHSSATGTGVHLYTSALPETVVQSASGYVTVWKEAQVPYVSSSLRLSAEIAAALTRSRVPVATGRTWMMPLDSLLCPAVAVEIAPLARDSNSAVTDAGYQQQVAEGIAGAMLFWHSKSNPTVPTSVSGVGQP